MSKEPLNFSDRFDPSQVLESASTEPDPLETLTQDPLTEVERYRLQALEAQTRACLLEAVVVSNERAKLLRQIDPEGKLNALEERHAAFMAKALDLKQRYNEAVKALGYSYDPKTDTFVPAN